MYSAYHWESGRPFPGPDVWIDIYTQYYIGAVPVLHRGSDGVT
jgi:hypothetical protein